VQLRELVYLSLEMRESCEHILPGTLAHRHPARSSQDNLTSRTALVVFSGAYDVTCKQQWSKELEALCTEPNVIIDLSDVSYLDATCLTEMLRMHERRRHNGFDREAIILDQTPVRRLFDLLNMEGVVRVVKCLDDATGPRRPVPVVHHAFCGKAGATRNLVHSA
jgi:anti-anti-sigma regulatory factor